MSNLENDLRNAAEEFVLYNPKAAGVLLPLKVGEPHDPPVYVIVGTEPAIRRLLETLK